MASDNDQSIDWQAVWAEYRPQLERVAFKILGSRDRAQDVVQDAGLKLIEAEAALGIKEPLAYLIQIVRNLAIDAHRRGAFETRVFAAEEDGVDVPAAASNNPESVAVSRQDLRIVADALAQLPERTRRAFELHRLGGLSQREVADELSVSPTLVNFMIRDALAHCAAALYRADG